MKTSTPFSAVNLIREADVDARTWNTLPSSDIVHLTIRAVEERGITVVMAANGDDALAVLKNLIPPGAEVMTGSSTTLIEIGFEEYIGGGRSGWKSLHSVITSENDEKKRAELRRKSVTADWFVSGANAIAQTGEIVACDAGGSRVGAWPFAAGHLILVVGINKIAPSLELAMQRVYEYAFRLENARAQRAYGTPSSIGKCVILAREKIPGRVTLVLVNEALGY
ncbi:lactate utilization protein [Methanoregula sp.]|uniref:lactate utilization protein n=1 Tax=Methanoregula sp. TaxID=2052170 RepID=UPI003C749B1A